MSKKRPKSFFDKVKDSSKDLLEGFKEEIATDKEKRTEPTQSKIEGIKTSVRRRLSETSSPEEVYYSSSNWFLTMIVGIFIIISIFLYGLINTNFLLVGLLSLIMLPFFVIWCLIHMIPTIKIFGFTIFDRSQLSLRRQLSVGKEIARFFSRDFLEDSPIMALLISLFLLFFVFALISALIG
ncbi:MAG: hypothetical protein ACTSR2_14250 [Candidatus Hodarchaeales archaeon]